MDAKYPTTPVDDNEMTIVMMMIVEMMIVEIMTEKMVMEVEVVLVDDDDDSDDDGGDGDGDDGDGADGDDDDGDDDDGDDGDRDDGDGDDGDDGDGVWEPPPCSFPFAFLFLEHRPLWQELSNNPGPVGLIADITAGRAQAVESLSIRLISASVGVKLVPLEVGLACMAEGWVGGVDQFYGQDDEENGFKDAARIKAPPQVKEEARGGRRGSDPSSGQHQPGPRLEDSAVLAGEELLVVELSLRHQLDS
eukprot:766008-Hanusia_phi.AAC.3